MRRVFVVVSSLLVAASFTGLVATSLMRGGQSGSAEALAQSERISGAPSATLTMGVDPDRGGPQPVGGNSFATGTFEIGMHVTALEGFSYQAYQIRLEYDDAKLDPFNLPEYWATNNTWPAPCGVFLAAGPTVTDEDDVGTAEILVNVTANCSHSSYVGEMGFLEFRCEALGPATLHLIPGDLVDTFLVDDDYANRVPTVVDATVTCVEPTPTPTLTPTPTVTPTPKPPAAVGGIAELPGLAGASAEEAGAPSGGSGWSVGNYAALAGGLALAAPAVATGAWCARKRWLGQRPY